MSVVLFLMILQIAETELRGRLSWNRFPDKNNKSKCSSNDQVRTSGASDVAPVIIGDEHDDAMTQTCALDLWAASLPHIDSDVSDDDDDGYCCYDSREYSTSGLIATSALSTTLGARQPHQQTRSGSKPTTILLVHPEPTVKGIIYAY